MPSAEHILLESDEREIPALQTARRIHARVRLRGGLWRRPVELALYEFFYLSVRREGPRSAVSQHVLDLRFVDPELQFTRHIAWRWMAVAMALFALGAGAALEIGGTVSPWWRDEWLPLSAGLLGAASCVMLAAVYRTTETLTLLSAHGRVPLLVHTGGPGSFRAFRRCRPLFDAHLRAAMNARRRRHAEHLRDEMREHHRLRCAGALSEPEYQSAKQRILASFRPYVPATPGWLQPAARLRCTRPFLRPG
ncbi:MAG TPA: hypothetical protein VFR29_02125 [Steroidobacteraceae bacterium]|nr:hypothetical protein [Steroidobacteraceae bacterium]